MKNFFRNLLKSIEDANKQNFGNKKMDCCDMNQQGNPNGKNPGQKKTRVNKSQQR